MAYTPLPTPPTRNDPATFADRGDAFLAALPNFGAEMNSAALTVAGQAVAVATDAAVVRIDTLRASAAALAAGAVVGAVAWVPGTTYALGDARYSLINLQAYRRKFAGAGATDPANDAGNWTRVGKGGLSRSARNVNTTLNEVDQGYLIDITSGTFTQTFTEAAMLDSGWWCYIRNSGTGHITLDPSGAELIDGLTSYVMYPGECRLVQCDGAAFTSVVLTPFSATFISSGTFKKPPGYANFSGLLWAGGGSGGKSSSGRAGAGGGGGASVPFLVRASAMSATETVTIGAGGASLTTVNTVGNVGGNSSLGSLVLSFGGGGGYGSGSGGAAGGGGGGALSAGASGTAGGSSPAGGNPLGVPETANSGFGGGAGGASGAGGGVVNGGFTASYGGAGGGGTSTGKTVGGASLYGGGGGGGSTDLGVSGAGGTSLYGGAGGAGAVTTASGTAGTAPGGGGGGGGAEIGASGAGARGELRIWGA